MEGQKLGHVTQTPEQSTNAHPRLSKGKESWTDGGEASFKSSACAQILPIIHVCLRTCNLIFWSFSSHRKHGAHHICFCWVTKTGWSIACQSGLWGPPGFLPAGQGGIPSKMKRSIIFTTSWCALISLPCRKVSMWHLKNTFQHRLQTARADKIAKSEMALCWCVGEILFFFLIQGICWYICRYIVTKCITANTQICRKTIHTSLRIKGYLNTCKGTKQSQFVMTKVKYRRQNYCVSQMSPSSHFLTKVLQIC